MNTALLDRANIVVVFTFGVLSTHIPFEQTRGVKIMTRAFSSEASMYFNYNVQLRVKLKFNTLLQVDSKEIMFI